MFVHLKCSVGRIEAGTWPKSLQSDIQKGNRRRGLVQGVICQHRSNQLMSTVNAEVGFEVRKQVCLANVQREAIQSRPGRGGAVKEKGLAILITAYSKTKCEKASRCSISRPMWDIGGLSSLVYSNCKVHK